MAANPYEELVETNPYEKLAEDTQPSQPTLMDKARSLAVKAAPFAPMLLAPIGGGLAKGMSAANELLEKSAYKAGGAVTDVLSPYVPPEVAAGAGYLTNVGVQAAPVLASGPMAKAITKPFIGGPLGRSLMQSAIKPTTQDLMTGKAARATETMLEQGLNITPGGVAKLQEKISAVGKKIDTILSMSPSTVNKKAVASRLHDALARVEKQVSPGADIKAVERAWQEFFEHPLLSGKDDISVKLANEIKQGTYKALGGKVYGELKGAEIEAQKTLARGLKEEIAKAVPQISPLNAQQSELLNALNVVERRALLQGNTNPLGLAPLAENPAAALAFAMDRSSWMKSLLARLAYSGTVPSTTAQLGTAALMTPQGQGGALYQSP